jgi:hypothetical protein
MSRCAWCKRGEFEVQIRRFNALWGVQGLIEKDHEFLQHLWELCPSCAEKARDRFAATIAGIQAEAPGEAVPRISLNPVTRVTMRTAGAGDRG